jgi:hypothetical protein
MGTACTGAFIHDGHPTASAVSARIAGGRSAPIGRELAVTRKGLLLFAVTTAIWGSSFFIRVAGELMLRGWARGRRVAAGHD